MQQQNRGNQGQGQGQGNRGGGGQGGAKGLQKEHEMTRTNPETGEEETMMVTQADWKAQGRDLRAQGWTRPEDEDETETEGEGDEEE